MEGVHRYTSVSEEEQRVASGPQVYLLTYDLHHHHVFPFCLRPTTAHYQPFRSRAQEGGS